MVLGGLGLVGVWQSFMSAWCMRIVQALALLVVLLMVQTFYSMKPSDWG